MMRDGEGQENRCVGREGGKHMSRKDVMKDEAEAENEEKEEAEKKQVKENQWRCKQVV